MRISDWSSDVCSSDLINQTSKHLLSWASLASQSMLCAIASRAHLAAASSFGASGSPAKHVISGDLVVNIAGGTLSRAQWTPARSEERRVGKEGVSPCRSRWSRYH